MKDFRSSNIQPEALFPMLKLIGVGILIFVLVIVASTSTYTVEPGFRGVEVTLGQVSPGFKAEGFGFKKPFITRIEKIPVRQITQGVKAECFSADLQQVFIDVSILYRIPEGSVVRIYKDYSGSPFESLIAPRVNEAVKEVTALNTAEGIVKKREEIKTKALALARQKIGDILNIEDLVVQNISLSKELEHAIEQKMVQEQEAAKAKYIQQKAEIEASTAVIRAKGEAEAIRIRGQALKETPNLIELQIVEKWNGVSPLVVGDAQGANILLPIKDGSRK
jgi:prohibitin 2